LLRAGLIRPSPFVVADVMSDENHKPDASPPKPRGRCPICGRPPSPETRPFCSARCRDVDLNRWLSGSYVIPSREDDVEDPE
jgi:uncharacterized protein